MPKAGEATHGQNELWAIRITFIDEKMNGLTPIGGSTWVAKQQQLHQWSAIPEFSQLGHSSFIADLLDKDASTILAVKRISAETCERLFGLPIALLIEEGRKDTCVAPADQDAAS